jgi:hypothetical protein
MARIAGVVVSRTDARSLIEELRQAGRADDATAAHAIERALARLAPVDDPTPPELRAVLARLDDPPTGLLDLRSQLAHHLGRRH